MKVAMGTAFATGASLEGGSYLDNAVIYTATDKLVGMQDFEKELEGFEKELLAEFHIKDDLTDTPSFPNIYKAGDEVSKPNMTLSEYNKRKEAYISENFDFIGDEVWMKGMSVNDAVDANVGVALVYGVIAGTLETMTASKFLKMMPNGWGPVAFRQQTHQTYKQT